MRGPFRLDLTVWLLRRRPHNAIDRWDGESYRRTLVVGGRALEVVVRERRAPSGLSLDVDLRADGDPPEGADAAEARGILSRLLGLDRDLEGFYRLARRDRWLAELARRFHGVRPPCFPSVFETLVNAIACQQLSLTVGVHLLNRLAATHGPLPVSGPGTVAGFPSPERLAGADPESLRSLGFSQAKAVAVILLARRVSSGEADLERLQAAPDGEALATLRSLRGIGRWSAEYTLLRGLGRWHVFPGDDVGARNRLARHLGLPAPLGGYEEVAALARRWQPYAGLVYFHLLLAGLAAVGHLPADPVEGAPAAVAARRTKPTRAAPRP